MLYNDVSRPSAHGRSEEKSVEVLPSYGPFKIRFNLPVFDYHIPEVEEYLDLLGILREIRDDDHADEFTLDPEERPTLDLIGTVEEGDVEQSLLKYHLLVILIKKKLGEESDSGPEHLYHMN